jgi:uncharacterized protein YigA (DUF484 family)
VGYLVILALTSIPEAEAERLSQKIKRLQEEKHSMVFNGKENQSDIKNIACCLQRFSKFQNHHTGPSTTH